MAGRCEAPEGDYGRRGVCAEETWIRSGPTTGTGAARRAAGSPALQPAVGEIDRDGGEGSASGDHGAGKPHPGDGSVRLTEWGVSAKGGGVRQPAGDQSSHRRGQRHFGCISEWVADCGAAGE